MPEVSVVLGMEDPAFQEEVLHFLDRTPFLRVVGAAGDAPGLAREVRDHRPDAAVVSPGLLAGGYVDGATVLVVAARETTSGLRAALRAGARGFYLWPDEREAMARDAERAARPRPQERPSPGRVVAVFGPRGGAGVTFVATNLAAACADRGTDTVLADLDPFFGDVAAALGIDDGAVPTIAELVPLVDELSGEHLDRVLHPHPRGFRVLLAPNRPLTDGLDPQVVSASIRALRARHEAVLLHVPRALDGSTRVALEEADLVLIVITLDVLALRDARRALDVLKASGLEGRCRLIVNRVGRGEIVPEDAERVLGLRPALLIKEDRAVRRAQDRGELVSGRSTPAARRVAALSRSLLDDRGEADR
ncbi:MAG: AAA family ATPase [Actinomycetota bacterium]